VFLVRVEQKAVAAYGAAPDTRFFKLGRFILKDSVNGNAETWLLSKLLRLLAQDNQGPDRRSLYDLCLSYRDPLPRETIET